MGIPLEQLSASQLAMIDSAEPKPQKRRGMTQAEIRDKRCKILERRIHDQFSGFAKRNGFIVWHSSPIKKTSVRTGLPDFLLWKDGRALGIEFKVPPNGLSAEQRKVFDEIRMVRNDVFVFTETAPGAAYTEATREVCKFFSLPLE